MKITDEMIEAAARAMCERDGFKWDAASVMETANGDEPEQQREYWLDKADAALTAALAVQTQQGVEVRRLEWDEDDTAENGFWGAYEITDRGDGQYDVSMNGGRIASGRKLPSKHAAKAAAQSDYETRIRSALVDVPAVESEPVATMDDEDRTPTPEGFDEALWRKADEVFHSTALVADDVECVKIVYAALA